MDVGAGVLVGTRVDVGGGGGVDVGGTGVNVGSSSFSLVGGKSPENQEVGVGVSEAPAMGITAELRVEVGNNILACVSGSTIPVGANSATILSARAAAVLFMLAKERS